MSGTCRCLVGRPATDGTNKIDHLFGPRGPTYNGGVVDGGPSDHRMIRLTTS
ncbi:hypothetical protein KUM39_22300 [Streptomyces sp. J2-1]|uniref:hypothetical protein n=1 Tax=Streptomyces corallincola TaxID=2851888 RepID=UPI001C37F50B|nr:hypothetical protein [Streptomyces corallincola]MBV2357071.1 hypothetical protein [Streptomyces corallincola]